MITKKTSPQLGNNTVQSKPITVLRQATDKRLRVYQYSIVLVKYQ